MILLPVVARELLVMARRRATYFSRTILALCATVVAAWVVLMAAVQMGVSDYGRTLFMVLSGAAFFFCLVEGVRVTSDCLSCEKRDGTLGLLFLTDLRGFEIVLGKAAAISIQSLYGVLTIVPLLSMALLLGGLTAGEVARTAIVLLNTLFFSLSAGVFVSALSKNERRAMFASGCLIALVALGPFLVAEYFSYNTGNSPFGDLQETFLVPSPVFAFGVARELAQAAPRFGTNTSALWLSFIQSLAFTHFLGWALLAGATVILPRVWHDRPKSSRHATLRHRWRRIVYGSQDYQNARRRRMLNVNPFLWLGARDRIKRISVWIFLGVLAVLWLVGYFRVGRFMLETGAALFLVVFVHAFLKVWWASEACARFSEDRKSGALELLLSTPLTIRDIVRGESLALRHLFGRGVAAVLVADLALVLASIYYDAAPDRSELVLAFGAAMTILILDLITLKWVCTWGALSTNSLSRALIGSVGRVLVLPWLIFFGGFGTIAFWFGAVLQRSFNPEFETFVMVWFAISVVVDVVCLAWARHHMFASLRTMAAERFQSRPQSVIARWFRRLFGRLAPASDSTNARRSIWRRWWWAWSAAAVLALCVGSYKWYRWSLGREVQKRIAAVSQAGFPVSRLDLARLKPLSSSPDNPLVTLEDAVRSMTTIAWPNRPVARSRTSRSTGTTWPLISPSQRMSPDLKDQLEQVVTDNAKALEYLHAAAGMNPAAFRVNAGASGRLYQLYRLPALLEAEAAVLAENGEVEKAVRSIEALFKLSRLAANETEQWTQHLRFFFCRTGIRALELLMTQRRLTDEQLSLLHQRLGETDNPEPITLTLAGQRAIAIEAFSKDEVVSTFVGPNPQEFAATRFLWWVKGLSGSLDREFSRYLDGMEALVNDRKKGSSTPEQLATLASSRTLRRGRSAILDIWSSLLIGTASLLQQEADIGAATRAAQIAIIAERYRLAHAGTPPQSLAEIATFSQKNLPLNPTTQTPYDFVRLTNGYAIQWGILENPGVPPTYFRPGDTPRMFRVEY